MDDEYKELIEKLKISADTQGVAVSSVKDGHILLLNRTVLLKYLNDHPDKDHLIIFAQTKVLN
jgi:L-lysine 2,3-aminomutase